MLLVEIAHIRDVGKFDRPNRLILKLLRFPVDCEVPTILLGTKGCRRLTILTKHKLIPIPTHVELEELLVLCQLNLLLFRRGLVEFDSIPRIPGKVSNDFFELPPHFRLKQFHLFLELSLLDKQIVQLRLTLNWLDKSGLVFLDVKEAFALVRARYCKLLDTPGLIFICARAKVKCDHSLRFFNHLLGHL